MGRCWIGRRPGHRSGGQRTSVGRGVKIRGEAEGEGGARGRRSGRRSLSAAGGEWRAHGSGAVAAGARVVAAQI
jgi:hypothetical protein